MRSAGNRLVGLLDTNVFLHAQSYDAHSEECLRFLEAVQRGRVRAQIDPTVLHELSYALPRYRKGMDRVDVAEYLLAVLGWEGVVCDKDVLARAVERWRDVPGLAFVDAYLATLAGRSGCAIYSKNVADFQAAGVDVPVPLPS